ncbi:MAG: aminotransferase class I/II-fold pyridoxal phosphate-dependent enzyme [Bacteroidales bacterium]|nr:aminotransferase class I/II-fold pyridoxal phosphate-dependent enzyme [Bacteroidales bacterium]
MKIDLRSDTVTKPSGEMLETMFSAKVGDDVLGEDPTLNELENKAANIFGMEAGLFCPSGTMTNQIAIKVQTSPGDEVICDSSAHVYNFEGGGIAFNSASSVRLINGNRGRFLASDVLDNINPDNVHYPHTQLVVIENTSNKGGGSIWKFGEIEKIKKVCSENNLSLHLDGARIFNALTETGENARDYGKVFDTISICLSKGLGTPVGSVLLGKADLIKKARRFRRVLGGGMRQGGYLGAAGIYALDHNIGRLKEDHKRAKQLAEILGKISIVEEILPVETNIVMFKLSPGLTETNFLKTIADENLLAVPFGKQTIRMVTHLDFTDDQLFQTRSILRKLFG